MTWILAIFREGDLRHRTQRYTAKVQLHCHFMVLVSKSQPMRQIEGRSPCWGSERLTSLTDPPGGNQFRL
jgi:hypothetical protein